MHENMFENFMATHLLYDWKGTTLPGEDKETKIREVPQLDLRV